MYVCPYLEAVAALASQTVRASAYLVAAARRKVALGDVVHNLPRDVFRSRMKCFLPVINIIFNSTK